MNKKTIILLLMILFTISSGFSHSGRTDSNGGHWNRKTGTYHYHNGGGSSGSSRQTYGNSSNSGTITVNNSHTKSYVYTSKDVNFRSGKSTSDAIIQVLKKDTLVLLNSIEDGWANISVEINGTNKSGWVAVSLLKPYL